MNPGPKELSSLAFIHWNLNRIAAHDFAKIYLIQFYALSYNTDIIFLSQIFLDSSIKASDANINVSGYNSLPFDHPSLKTKRGRVSMFYKDYLPVIGRDDLCALSECIVTKIKLEKNPYFLLAIIDLQVKFQMNLRTIVNIFTFSLFLVHRNWPS